MLAVAARQWWVLLLQGFLGIAVARTMPQNVLRAVILIIGVIVTALYFVKIY